MAQSSTIIVADVPFWCPDDSGIFDSGIRSTWDKCQLGKHLLPGLVCVTIATPAERKLDIKDPKGKTGATMTVEGWKPAKVDIQLLLWTPEQWKTWREIRPLLRDPADRKESDPMEIHSTVTDEAGIRSVIISSIGGITNGTTKGTKTLKISASEWCPSPKKTPAKKPTTTSSAGVDRLRVEEAWAIQRYKGSNEPWDSYAYKNGINPPGTAPPVPSR